MKQKMGILTNPDGGGRMKIVKLMRSWSNLICFIAYVAGGCWLGVLIHPSFNARTYFSENALLPGLVDEEFSESLLKSVIVKELKEQRKLLSQIQTQEGASTKDKNLFPAKWLEEKFTSLGLESYVQNFTVEMPITGKSVSGENVYAVVRAGREASTESLVVATPYKKSSASLSLPLILNLANFCRQQIYWAKDIIFVVVEHEDLGMQAWLSAYHKREKQNMKADPLSCHGGSIQAAVAFEIPSSGPFTHAEIKFNMFNGQLPNLDLLNLLVRMAEKEALEPTIFQKEIPWNIYSTDAYFKFAKTCLLGLTTQASCKGNGIHGPFGSYGIEAATIIPYQNSRTRGQHQEYYVGSAEIGRILEGVLRSLNNLLERFHQSFFFYMKPSSRRYVSIGLYMPAVGIMLLAPLIKACCTWAELNDLENSTEPQLRRNTTLLGIMPYLILSNVMGWLLYYIPQFLALTSSLHSAHFSTLSASAGTSLALLIFPWLLSRNFSNKELDLPSPDLLRSLSLILLALVVGVTSVLNFGLGFFLALLWIPPCMLAVPSKTRFGRFIRGILVLAVNPLVTLFLVQLTLASISSAQLPPLTTVVNNTYTNSMEWIFSLVADHVVHNSWFFPFITLGLVPMWLQFWIIVLQKAD